MPGEISRPYVPPRTKEWIEAEKAMDEWIAEENKKETRGPSQVERKVSEKARIHENGHNI